MNAPAIKRPEMIMQLKLHLSELQAAELNRQRELYGECLVRITADGKFFIVERTSNLILPAFDGGHQLVGGVSNGKA